MEQITRDYIFSNYPWLKPNSGARFIIMGDDIDAALSTVIYLHLNRYSKVVGCYNQYKDIYFSDLFFCDFNLLRESENILWMDLDINHKACKSLGHHIIRYGKNDDLENFKNSCNINELIGRSVKNNYIRKYPLGTIHFLLWLFNHEIPDKKNSDKLIWLADSAFINSQSHRFRDNAEFWIKKVFPLNSLIDSFDNDIQTHLFEEEMKTFQNDLLIHGFKKGRTQVNSKLLKLSGFQCQPEKVPKDIIDLLKYVSRITGWKIGSDQIALNNLNRVSGIRKNIRFSKILRKQGGLIDFLDSQNVFSYVFDYKNRLNYTCF